jgi:prepilin-type N-terminal cleavage/methylation domain-containing protein
MIDSKRKHKDSWIAGVSLIELMVALTIIGLLVALSFPLYGFFKAKAAYVGCINNLTSIHGGLSSYMQDHNMIWPQMSEQKHANDEENSDPDAEFWFNTLKEYGISKKTWVCSSDELPDQEILDEHSHISSYGITEFDSQPNRAYQWVGQPWAVESGDNHGRGKGPNVLFPDGRIERGMPLLSPE